MRFIILSLVMLSVFSANSQQVISSAGNTSEADGVILSWTIGEGVISTLGADETDLTQGFHQPLIVDVIPTSIEKNLLLEIRAFPNPTYDRVMFEGGDPVGTYHIRIVDKLGRVLEQKTLPFSDLTLEMKKYNNGSYIIEVIEDKTGKRKIFNIVKSQR